MAITELSAQSMTGASSAARRRRTVRVVSRALFYAVIILFSVTFVFPYFWTVGSSLKTPLEIMRWPPSILPLAPQWGNYPEVFREAPFALFIYNSLVVACLATLGQGLAATIVAYGFGRLRFPGRGVLFAICLSTMIIPEQVTIVPLFLLFRKIGWIDTFYPLIVPSFFGGAFSIFLLRQFIMTIPYELDEAAIIDGANRLTILWKIIVPNCGPAISTVTIFAFMGAWNSFLEPYIFLNTNTKFTLSVGIRYLNTIPTSNSLPKDNLMMAASIMMTAPIIILFFVAQEYFVQGIVTTGIKG
jgi:multiple sugar transport system permease protein